MSLWAWSQRSNSGRASAIVPAKGRVSSHHIDTLFGSGLCFASINNFQFTTKLQENVWRKSYNKWKEQAETWYRWKTSSPTLQCWHKDALIAPEKYWKPYSVQKTFFLLKIIWVYGGRNHMLTTNNKFYSTPIHLTSQRSVYSCHKLK